MEFGVVKVWGELVLAMQSKEVLLRWHVSFVGKRRANLKDGPTFIYVRPSGKIEPKNLYGREQSRVGTKNIFIKGIFSWSNLQIRAGNLSPG